MILQVLQFEDLMRVSQILFASTDRWPIPQPRHEQTNHEPHRDVHGGSTSERATC